MAYGTVLLQLIVLLSRFSVQSVFFSLIDKIPRLLYSCTGRNNPLVPNCLPTDYVSYISILYEV